MERHGSLSDVTENRQSVVQTVQEAGRRGGLRTLEKHGSSFFSVIGRRGQIRMREKWPGMAKTWGGRGGRPRKGSVLCGEALATQRKEVDADPSQFEILGLPATSYQRNEQGHQE